MAKKKSEKRAINVSCETPFGSYFDFSIETLQKWLHTYIGPLKRDLSFEEIDNATFRVEYEHGYYDSVETKMYMDTFRMETDQEFEDRLTKEADAAKRNSETAKKAAETKKRNEEARELAEFKRLTEKFKGKKID